MIKNWQLISLIDIDAMIACKTLAKHLGNVLTEIMHSNQNAFVKGRSIFDAITTIDDLWSIPKEKEPLGSLAAIDFEKAFDTFYLRLLLLLLLLLLGLVMLVSFFM